MLKDECGRFSLGNTELEIWYCGADILPQTPELGAFALLGSDKVRYERLVMPDVRQEFLRSRQIISDLIKVTKITPKIKALSYSKNKNPICIADDPVFLSWSRSLGELALAITTEGELGIDIEVFRDMSYGAMLNMICGPSELAAFHRLDEPKKRKAFFRVWTIKEAILKSIGTGFQTSAKSISVPQSAYAQKEKPPFLLECLNRQFEVRQFESDHAVIALALCRDDSNG